MNLLELTTKIKNITDYAPTTQSYQDDLSELINDAYYHIYSAKRWNFASKRILIDIYPDIAPDDTGPNASVLDGRRNISFSAAIPEFEENPQEWEGQMFQYEGRAYHIDQVISSSAIRLREPFRGTTTVDGTDWKIFHQYYQLPEDCVEILGLAHTDMPVAQNASGVFGSVWGKKAGLTPRTEEELNLRRDYTADYAEGYVLLPPIEVTPAEKFGTVSVQQQGGPNTSPLLNNQYWEFTWAFLQDGEIGALSEPQIINTGANEQVSYPVVTLQLETWDDRPMQARTYDAEKDVYRTPLEGLKKVLFYNSNFDKTTGERKGLPCWRQVRDADPVATRDDWQPLICADDASTFVIQYATQVYQNNPRYREIDGQHLRFRPWPRPQGSEKTYDSAAAVQGTMSALHERRFRQWELRYLLKPHRMVLKTDSPQMPYEFHRLVIYQVLFDIYMKGNSTQQAQLYERKIEKEIKQLERRYVDNIDISWQRGSFEAGRYGIQFDVNSFRKLN